MRDLVEFVIDGIQQQERLQQQQAQRSRMTHRQPVSNQPSHAQLHAVGTQVTGGNKERNEELWKASQQFEAIFIQQMMGEMRKTVVKSDFIPQGYAEDVHASMMDEAIASASAKRGNFGIAQAIYRQLEAAENRGEKPASAQEISNTADKLKMTTDVTLEATKHAY